MRPPSASTWGSPTKSLKTLYQGGFLHDLGKIGIPDSVLLKPSALTGWEFDLVKQHPIVGARLCEGLRSLRAVRPLVRHHHERLDGSGYPDGLAGDEIPLLAQIMSIVDVYDALTTPRPYRPAVSRDEACKELLNEVARGWRRGELVREFIAIDSRRLVPRSDNDAMLRMRFGLEGKRPRPVAAIHCLAEGANQRAEVPWLRARPGGSPATAPRPRFNTRSSERAG